MQDTTEPGKEPGISENSPQNAPQKGPHAERQFSGRNNIERRPRRSNDDSRTKAPTPRRKMHTPAELTQRVPSERVPRMRKPQSEETAKHPDGRTVRQPFDGVAHLYEVIQVRLSRTLRLVEVNTNALRLEPNTPVLIRVHRNILLATTVGYRYRRVAEINSLPFVIRVASEEDKRIDAENADIEKYAQELASNYAIEQNLQMKVLSADLSHDHKNITINFASDVRVDFRDMVAFLAGQLKLRVEMYQLGLRNGTGIICGLGACGQLLCCGRFLGQFDPIAVKQLRAQGLATNPKRISGVCGRLYCCMSYEYCDYMKERRSLPKKGRRIFSRWGIGRVTDIDMLREEVVVTYENGEVQRLTPHDFVPVTDEILAKTEAGEYEFPLEPIKFYLNHSKATAVEMDGHTKTVTRTVPQHRSDAALPKQGGNAAAEPNAGTVREKLSKPSHTRRKKAVPRPRPQVAAVAKSDVTQATAAPAKTGNRGKDAIKVRRVRTENAASASSAPAAAASVPASGAPAVPNPGERHAPSPGSRAPRKVKARQANLEESLNNSESRPIPAKTSRRRYSPLNNQNS